MNYRLLFDNETRNTNISTQALLLINFLQPVRYLADLDRPRLTIKHDKQVLRASGKRSTKTTIRHF